MGPANPTHGRRRAVRLLVVANVIVAMLVVGAGAWWVARAIGDRLDDDASDVAAASDDDTDALEGQTAGDGATTGQATDGGDGATTTGREDNASDSSSTAAPATTEAGRPPYDGWWNPELVGVPQSETVDGIITFRGSPNRTYYGRGPVPTRPQVAWTFPPEGGMCSPSTVGGETTTWCGTGWTGQPSVWEREDGTWLAFGAYDRNVHFLNADTGERMKTDFPTGDIIKGSVTVDPDGYPLLYTGSRDNFLHVVAYDRGPEPVELWSLNADAIPGRRWNNDWDGSPVVLDDYLFEGGENSVFHIVKLNRGYDGEGKVTVNPELVFTAPGYDDELLNAVGTNVSIENSVAVSGNTVYFSNSGGLVQGWDISGLAEGAAPTQVFRWWAGDDMDASLVVDEQGMIYAGVEYERDTARSREVGQIIKLDPSRPDDPLVWGAAAMDRINDGVWGTPALHRDVVYVPTDTGRLIAVDRATGAIRWEKSLPGPLWQSPVVVDDVLVMGDCSGILHGFDVSDTTVDPPELWSVELGGCIESTPAVWDGWIYVGTRSGSFFALRDP
jgi:PQQ-like domain